MKDYQIKGNIETSSVPRMKDGKIKTAKSFGKRSYPNMAGPKINNIYAMKHGAMSVKLPKGWEKDWIKQYRALKRYYQEEVLKNKNPIFDMIFKKIAYFSVKVDCAMAYMESDICPENFVENLQHLAMSFLRQVDQLLKYTQPLPKAKKALKPLGEMTDEEIRAEIERVESIAGSQSKDT